MVTDADIQRYEGLIFTTATLYEGKVEGMDLDDLRQVFRIKVWRALESYDPKRSSLPEGRFVFGCLVNQGKDLIRRRKPGVRTEDGRFLGDIYIEDVAPATDFENGPRDRFEANYLSVSSEEVFELIEREEAVVPNTLTGVERSVVCLLYASYKKSEIARHLGLSRREMAAAIEAIHTKMADWAPSQEEEAVAA